MSSNTCALPECDRPSHGKGVCRRHYMKAWRGQIAWPEWTPPRPPTASERFWAKADRTDGCWLWTGSLYRNGYGQFDGMGAHRFAYEDAVGAIPAGLVIDHLCQRRACVNPAHLEPVTQAVNAQRGYVGPVAASRQKEMSRTRTHCRAGHEMTEANTYVTPREGWRSCRACRSASRRRRNDPTVLGRPR